MAIIRAELQLPDGRIVTMLDLKGAPDPGGMMLENITRPGFDGVAFRQLGRRGEPFSLYCLIDEATPTSAANTRQALKDAQGQTVTLTDNFGRVWYDLVLLRMTVIEERAIDGAIGSSGATASTVLLSLVLDLQQA